jgi:hypothetical protein
MTPLALSRGRRRCRLAPTHYNDARQWRPTSRLYFLRVMPAGLAWAGVVNQFTDTMRDHGAEGDLWAVRALQAPRPFVGLWSQDRVPTRCSPVYPTPLTPYSMIPALGVVMPGVGLQGSYTARSRSTREMTLKVGKSPSRMRF